MKLMKNAIKLALAGSALVGGVAQAAITNVIGTGTSTFSTQGSDLVLFAKDYSSTTYYYVDLGIQIGQLLDLDHNVTGATTGTQYIDGSLFNSATVTTAVNTLLGQLTPSHASSIKWSIIGGERNNTSVGVAFADMGFTTNKPGYLTGNALTNGNVSDAVGNAATFFRDINSGATTGWDGTGTGANADLAFLNSSFSSGDYLGTTLDFWIFAENGSSTAPQANKYLAGSLSLSFDNGLAFTQAEAPVPLPAGIWLLGSGLLGLVGVSRRKKAAT